MSSVGCALPAQHQTTSGGAPSFHATGLATTQAHPDADDMFATMWWKRWVSGDQAPYYIR